MSANEIVFSAVTAATTIAMMQQCTVKLLINVTEGTICVAATPSNSFPPSASSPPSAPPSAPSPPSNSSPPPPLPSPSYSPDVISPPPPPPPPSPTPSFIIEQSDDEEMNEPEDSSFTEGTDHEEVSDLDDESSGSSDSVELPLAYRKNCNICPFLRKDKEGKREFEEYSDEHCSKKRKM